MLKNKSGLLKLKVISSSGKYSQSYINDIFNEKSYKSYTSLPSISNFSNLNNIINKNYFKANNNGFAAQPQLAFDPKNLFILQRKGAFALPTERRQQSVSPYGERSSKNHWLRRIQRLNKIYLFENSITLVKYMLMVVRIRDTWILDNELQNYVNSSNNVKEDIDLSYNSSVNKSINNPDLIENNIIIKLIFLKKLNKAICFYLDCEEEFIYKTIHGSLR